MNQKKSNGRPGLFDKGIAHGSSKAAGHLVGILDPVVGAVLDDFHRFKKPEARAAFAGTWLTIVAKSMDRTWPVIYELLSLVKDKELYKQEETLKIGLCFDTFPDFFEKVMGQPFETWAELEETYHFVKDNCPERFKGTYTEAVGARQAAAMEAARENTEPLASDGGDRKSAAVRAARESMEPTSGNQSLKKTNQNSDSRSTGSSSYRIRRLRRDHPTIAQRLEAGEFKSVAAAERAARGENPHPDYPKKTALMWLEHWWGKADAETREKFIAWIGERNEGEP